MRRRQVVLVVLIVVVASTLSALVAYRRGVRQSHEPGVDRTCVDFRQALDHTGETTCVAARVLRVYTSRNGNTFLDFCQDYRHCAFSSVIFAADHDKFGNLGALTGRAVEIRGSIVPYSGHAEIVIHDPGQIRAVE